MHFARGAPPVCPIRPITTSAPDVRDNLLRSASDYAVPGQNSRFFSAGCGNPAKGWPMIEMDAGPLSFPGESKGREEAPLLVYPFQGSRKERHEARYSAGPTDRVGPGLLLGETAPGRDRCAKRGSTGEVGMLDRSLTCRSRAGSLSTVRSSTAAGQSCGMLTPLRRRTSTRPGYRPATLSTRSATPWGRGSQDEACSHRNEPSSYTSALIPNPRLNKELSTTHRPGTLEYR
jgi:hypothetical protein